MLKEWVMEHPEEEAEVCRVQVLSGQRLPDPILSVKAHSAHLPPGLQQQTLLPGLLMEGIPDQVIAVITGHQVPSKGMLLRSKGYPIGRERVLQQDLILPMKDKELLMSKTIPETEPMLTTVIEISI